jgi:hypothetical protein
VTVQRQQKPDMRVVGPLIFLAGLVVIASVTIVYSRELWQNTIADDAVLKTCGAFALFIAVGEIMRLTLPGGRESAPLASAGALAFALLPLWGGIDGTKGVPTPLVITVVTIGSLVGAFPRAIARRAIHVDELARRILVTLVASVLMHQVLIWAVPPTTTLQEQAGKVAVLAALVAALASVVDALLAAAIRSGNERVPMRTAVVDEARALIGIASAIAATGVLIALSYPRMHLWALPIFAIPLLLTQFSFRRYATIQATYLQTIRSLSKVTEVGGYTETGHSRRVADLAVTVGRELGLSQRDLDDLEYAALMHDIGQLSLSEPIPGGATTLVSQLDQCQIAEYGAEVIAQAGVLDKVAVIVERQSDPYRPRRGSVDPDLPLESRIIKVCNAYDDLAGTSLESDRQLQALERLALGTDREYDPVVVDMLAAIVMRDAVAV